MHYHIGLGVGHTYSRGLYPRESGVSEAESGTKDDSEPSEVELELSNNVPFLANVDSIADRSEAMDLSTDEDSRGGDFRSDGYDDEGGGHSNPHSEECDGEYLANEEMYGP